MDAPTVMVELERTRVLSTHDVYVFLMDELPFTAAVLRELGESTYEIERRGDVYVLDDRAGLVLEARLIHRDESRWIWTTTGGYSLGLFGTARGRSVIIVRCALEGGTLDTEARVYAKLENALLDRAAKAMRGAVEGMIRDKSQVFVRSARLVAEITARDAAGLARTVDGAPGVDQAVLAEFRRRFVR
jgi:hypothetical protein